MTKTELYEFCKAKREANATWLDIQKQLKKLNAISLKTTVEDLKAIYRDLAAEAALTNEVEDESFDSKLEKFNEWIGKNGPTIVKPPKVKVDGGKETTIIISDVHVPYHDMSMIVKIAETWKGIAHRLVIAGDFLNGTQLSTHPQVVFEDFKKEVQAGRVVLEYLCSIFPEVVLTDDNHVHSRWQKYIAKNLRADLHFLTIHPYDFMTAGLNVVRAKTTHEEFCKEFSDEFGWMYRQGDAYFAHAEISTTDEFRTAKRVKEFIDKWRPVWGWPEPRLVGQAHTHNSGMLHGTDMMYVLTGCTLSLEAVRYSMGAAAQGKPPIHGYVVLVQEEGRTCLEESRSVRIPYSL